MRNDGFIEDVSVRVSGILFKDHESGRLYLESEGKTYDLAIALDNFLDKEVHIEICSSDLGIVCDS